MCIFKRNLYCAKNVFYSGIKNQFCDCAGFYEISYRTLRNCFNEEITKSDFEGLKQIRTALSNQNMIQQKIIENHSIISILNYNNYQDESTNSTTNSITNGHKQ